MVTSKAHVNKILTAHNHVKHAQICFFFTSSLFYERYVDLVGGCRIEWSCLDHVHSFYGSPVTDDRSCSSEQGCLRCCARRQSCLGVDIDFFNKPQEPICYIHTSSYWIQIRRPANGVKNCHVVSRICSESTSTTSVTTTTTPTTTSGQSVT